MRTMVVVALAGLVAAVASAQSSGDGQELTGVWQIVVTIPPGSSACPANGPACEFRALANANSDGTAIQTAAVPGTSTGHGVWTKTGDRAFRLRTTYFRTDPAAGTLLGTAETESQVTLDASGAQASGTYTNKVIDTAGAQVGSFSATVTATRIVQ